MASISTLPSELLLHVLYHLRHDDITTLARVCSQFYKIIEPILWNRVELHRVCFHEGYALKELREEEIALDRPYHRPDLPFTGRESAGLNEDDLERASDTKADLFLAQFSPNNITDAKRAAYLAGLVRWLCLPVNGVDLNFERNGEIITELDTWNTFQMFTNLQHLEISAWWSAFRGCTAFRSDVQTTLRLKTLKLRGYLPVELVRYFLRSAPTIKELQLAILDIPIQSELLSHVENPAPSPPEGYEDMSPEEIEEKFPDYEDLEGECVAPRSLACLTPDIVSRLTSLARLHVWRPIESFRDEEDRFSDMLFSEKSTNRILDEWISLFRVTRTTVEHLILEQRPVGDHFEPESTGNSEFMDYSHNGIGYRKFLETALPVLLDETQEWPALKMVHLFGFENPDESSRSERSVHVDKQLEKRFPGVKVITGMGRRIIVEQNGEIEGGGDVLESCNSFDDEESDEEE